MPHLRQMYLSKPSADRCAAVIAAADDLGDKDAREEFYELLGSKHKDSSNGVQVCDIFHAVFDSKGTPAIDVKAVDNIVQTVTPYWRSYFNFVVGVFLTNHGNKDDARRYLESSKAEDGNVWRRAVIGDCLHRLGVDPTRSEFQLLTD
jgi:hypothetical protein